MAFTPGHPGFHPWENSALALNGAGSPADEGHAASSLSGTWPVALAGLPSAEQSTGPPALASEAPLPRSGLMCDREFVPGGERGKGTPSAIKHETSLLVQKRS